MGGTGSTRRVVVEEVDGSGVVKVQYVHLMFIIPIYFFSTFVLSTLSRKMHYLFKDNRQVKQLIGIKVPVS